MMSQIQYFTHRLQYIIQLVNKFQIVITHECQVIRIQIPVSNQICSFLTILDSISWLISLFIHDGQIQYCTHQLQYIIQLVNKFQIVITHECKVIHKQIPKSNQICSFLKLLDSISWLISLFIHDGPNSILYPSTTIYYPTCQQISDCDNARV